jgi:hypothetical protein
LGDRGEDLARETVDGIAISFDALEDHELVAAEPANEMSARRQPKSLRSLDQQGVAGRVTERVVDDLELVEIEAVKRKEAAVTVGRVRFGSPVRTSLNAS